MSGYLSILAVGLFGSITVVGCPQEQSPAARAPADATIITGGPTRFTPEYGHDQEFKFTVLLDPTPRGYHGATLGFLLAGPRFDGTSIGTSSGRTTIPGGTDLIDGKASYEFSVPITYMMAAGKWQLAGLWIRKTLTTPIRTKGGFLFEIAAMPVVIHISLPQSIKTGQQFAAKIDAEVPAGFRPDCRLFISGAIYPSGPYPYRRLNTSDAPTLQVSLRDRDLLPGKSSFEITGYSPIPIDAPTGTWSGELLIDSLDNPINASPDPRAFCHPPPLSIDGQPPQFEDDPFTAMFPLRIELAQGFVAPRSAVVVVSADQARLLRDNAKGLKLAEQKLRGQLNPLAEELNHSILLAGLVQAMGEVDQTESKYSGPEQGTANGNVYSFFEDIRFEYREAIRKLQGADAVLRASAPHLQRASARAEGPTVHLDIASENALGSILHNAAIYEAAADAGQLTFDLKVASVPPGAKVFYKQRWNPDYAVVNDATTCTIENLTYGTWLIKVQKSGYKDGQAEFDAMRTKIPSIEVPLEPEQGTK